VIPPFLGLQGRGEEMSGKGWGRKEVVWEREMRREHIKILDRWL
jgi:hypothetical protein